MAFFGLNSAVDVEFNLTDEFQRRVPRSLIRYLKEVSEFIVAGDHGQTGGRLDELLFMMDVVIDYSWEMLNTNMWVFVDDSMRLLYGYATLYKVILVALKSPHTRTSPDQLVKLCDLGLLMTGHLLEKKFNAIIRHVRNESAAARSSVKHEHDAEIKTPASAKTPRLESAETLPVISAEHALAIEDSPSIERFRTEYLEKQIPCIIRNQMSHWPALTKWSLDYIIGLAGKRTVPIEIGSKYSDNDWSQKLMTIEEFIEKYIVNVKSHGIDDSGKSKGYLAQHPLFEQIPELKEDIYIPEYCYYASSSDDVEDSVEINAWFGPGGTVSPLHYDPKPNFLCQVIGQKYARLIDEAYSDRLYPHGDRILKNTSQLDFTAADIDYERFPLARGVPFWEGILNPGDMLFIPPKCWHFMRSLSLSFSVNFWWE